MNEIIHIFNHLLTQLVLIGFRIKVSKCKLQSPSRIFPSIEIPQVCILVTYDLCILDVLVGFQDFATHFLDEALSQDVAHIDDFPFLGDTQVVLGILSSWVTCQPFYFIWIIPPFSSFLFLLVGFDLRVIQVCGDIMGLRSWEFF